MSDHDQELYLPSTEIAAQANVKESDYQEIYARSIQDREGFWAEQASRLDWFRKWDQVLDETQKPFFQWFKGGKFNIVHNAIDRHLAGWRRNKLALIWEGEPGDSRTYSYYELNREVSRFASVLKSFGVAKGDIVTLYLPQIPELPIAMLACAKIGAAHSVVFGGFSAEALATRIRDAKSRVVVTADGGYRRGKEIDLKGITHQALQTTPTVETCITVKRTGHSVIMEPGRDHWYHELMMTPAASSSCPTEVLDAEDPLFILYTSGTTGKPKGLLHTHAGYAVYAASTLHAVFDLKDEDRYWCTADPGWITGHSYLVYGPLLNGATVMMYEGAPTHPHPNRWWEIVEKYGITILYTSPTAIRGLMRLGEEWPERHDLKTLRLLGSVGEPINPEAWRWYHRVIGGGRCPIMDTWWQTETGGFVIAPLPGRPLKPGSATQPFFGHEVGIVDDQGKELPAGQEGNLVLKAPWPGMARTIFGDPERYRETYWSTFSAQGWYKAGDSARKDADGYYWIIGRTDDVIKVSGHRLGTAEIESALVSHPDVAEAAVIGLPHEVKGQGIHCFVLLKNGKVGSANLEILLKSHVASELGALARPEKIDFMDALPKTRSGKIMRRVLRSRALGQDIGDTSTLEE